MSTTTPMRTEEPKAPTGEPTEETFTGTLGTAQILTHPNGQREITVTFASSPEKTLRADSRQVDLDETGSKTLAGALTLAVTKTGTLPIFEKSELKGTKALISVFRRTDKPERGYAIIVKKGVKPLRFSLDRIDLAAMKAKSTNEALRKTAWETGSVRLKK